MAGAKWKARSTVKSASGTMWVAREAAGGQHDPDDRYRYRYRPMATGRIGDLRPKRCAEHRHEGEEAHEDADLEPAEAATGAVDRQVRHDGRQGSVVEEVEGARGAHALGAYGAAGVVTPAPAARRLPQRQLPLSARAGRRLLRQSHERPQLRSRLANDQPDVDVRNITSARVLAAAAGARLATAARRARPQHP